MGQSSADLIINARWIVPMSRRGEVLERHALVVADGRIAALLPQAEAAQLYEAALTHERPRHLLMPGLVNAHTQAGLSLLCGLGARLPRGDWPRTAVMPLERRFAAAPFVHDAALLSLAQMLKAGITCFGDMYLFPDQTARAADEQGVRACIGMPVADEASPWAQSADEYLSRALGVRDEYKGHPRISTAFAPEAAYGLGDATLVRIRTLADELDAGIMIRLHESKAEIADSLRRHGLRPIARLERLGMLNPALNAIHMAHVDAADIEIAQRAGIAVTLCPGSNMRLGNGLAPVARWRSSSARLALGTDGAAANEDQDLWSQIRLAALIGCADGGESMRAGAWDCLAMATRGGAAALGLEEQIGSLEPGKWADLACLDLAQPATQPVYDPLERLVFSAGRDCVSDVWVAGRQLVAERRLTRLDWGEVAARTRDWADRLSNSGALSA